MCFYFWRRFIPFLRNQLRILLEEYVDGGLLVFAWKRYSLSRLFFSQINTGNVTLFDSKDVFNANVKSESPMEVRCQSHMMVGRVCYHSFLKSSAQEDGEASDELHITYQLYEGFWKLQVCGFIASVVGCLADESYICRHISRASSKHSIKATLPGQTLLQMPKLLSIY